MQYTVNRTGFLNNVYRKAGAVIDMPEAAAKWLTPPYGHRLAPVKVEAAQPPVEAPAKRVKRIKRRALPPEVTDNG